MQTIQKESPNTAGIFWGLLFLFILTRIGYLLLAHPFYQFVYRMEELYRGAMAQEFLHGGLASVFQYRPDDYAGGSFVISAITAMLFRFFPATVFTLKLTSVIWSSLTFSVWYFAVKRLNGLKTAVLFALVFIFAPPVFFRYLLAPIGDHAETLFFMGFELLLFVRILENKKESPVLGTLMGLSAGFGIWFAYIHLFFVLSLTLFWLWSNPRSWRSSAFIAFALGSIAGFSPWILINLKTHAAGFWVQGRPFWAGFDIKNFAKRILDFRTSTLYQLFSYFDILEPPFLGSKPVIWFYRFIFLTPPAVYTLRCLKNKKAPDWRAHPLVTISVIYLALFCFVTQFTDYSATRYWIPAKPLLFYLCVWCLFQLFPHRKKLTAVFTGFLIFGTCLWQGKLIALPDAGYTLKSRGYAYAWLIGSPACSNSKQCLDAYLYFEPRLSEEGKESIILDLCLALASDLPFENLQKELDDAEKVIPERLLGTFYYALGYEIFARNNQDFLKTIRAVNRDIPARGENYYQLTVWGAMDCGLNSFEGISPETMFEIEKEIPEFAKNRYWRLRGYEWYQMLVFSKPPPAPLLAEIQAFLPQIPENLQGLFIEGIGKGIYSHWRINQQIHYADQETFLSLPPDWQTMVVRGGGRASSKLPDWDQHVLDEIFLNLVGRKNQSDFEKARLEKDEEFDRLGFSF